MRITDTYRRIGATIVRARRGWAPTDTWSADLYICHVIGEMLLHLAEHGHGWPGTEEFPTSEDWNSALRRHGDRLVRYAAEPLQMDSVQPDAQASLHWVAEHLGAIWD